MLDEDVRLPALFEGRLLLSVNVIITIFYNLACVETCNTYTGVSTIMAYLRNGKYCINLPLLAVKRATCTPTLEVSRVLDFVVV